MDIVDKTPYVCHPTIPYHGRGRSGGNRLRDDTGGCQGRSTGLNPLPWHKQATSPQRNYTVALALTSLMFPQAEQSRLGTTGLQRLPVLFTATAHQLTFPQTFRIRFGSSLSMGTFITFDCLGILNLSSMSVLVPESGQNPWRVCGPKRKSLPLT